MKIKPKLQVKLEPKSRDPYIRRSDEEMIKVVKEIQSGLISIKAACIKYGLCRNTLKLFITKFSIRTLGDKFSKQILSRINENQKESALHRKIQELTKDLEYAKQKIIARIILTYNERRPHSSIDFLTPEQAHNKKGIMKKRWKQYSKQEKPKEQILI